MLHDILAFVPLTFLIVMALATRKMAESMITAVIVAMAIVYKEKILTGTLETLYEQLSNSSLQFVFIILFGFGGLIQLFQRSGGLEGLAVTVDRFASGKKKPLILAWILAFFLFVDDYMNVLTINLAFKKVADRNGIPREHIAFQSNSIASSLCVIIPFSSWTAFSIGLISDYGYGFTDYVHAIKYMFFPISITVVCLLVALGVVPKVGELKKAFDRVNAGGPTFVQDEGGDSLVDIEVDGEVKESSPLNALLPLLLMVAGTLVFDYDLAHGIIIALAAQFIMYVSQKIMSPSEFVKNFFEGAKSMTTLAILCTLGFMLTSANQRLGFFDIVIGGVGNAVPAWALPVLAFIIVGFTTFATGGCWTMQIIALPIFMPLTQAAGVSVEPLIAAVMSAVTLGYTICFYADAVFMTSASSGISNIKIVTLSMPYAITCAALSAAGFLVLGLTM